LAALDAAINAAQYALQASDLDKTARTIEPLSSRKCGAHKGGDMLKQAALAIVAATALSSVALAQGLPAPSIWTNQRSSVLSITSVDAGGKITGTFVNNAAGTDCVGKPEHDVAGKLSGSSVVLVVTFTKCNTVTVWRGKISGSKISAPFEAAYPDATGRLKIWKGTDTFTKQ
jgi:hypothetical protein